MLCGTVRWWLNEKGYGFIDSPDGDIFVHWRTIEMDGHKTLEQGQTVWYELERSDRGLRAARVLVNKPAVRKVGTN